MIFWMRRGARTIKADLTDALGMGPTAVAALAFVAVIREGIEMVLLVLASAQTAGPLAGVLSGVASAVLLGWLMYAAAAKVDLTPSGTVLEIAVWVAYAIGVLILFFFPGRRSPAGAGSQRERPPGSGVTRFERSFSG